MSESPTYSQVCRVSDSLIHFTCMLSYVYSHTCVQICVGCQKVLYIRRCVGCQKVVNILRACYHMCMLTPVLNCPIHSTACFHMCVICVFTSYSMLHVFSQGFYVCFICVLFVFSHPTVCYMCFHRGFMCVSYVCYLCFHILQYVTCVFIGVLCVFHMCVMYICTSYVCYACFHRRAMCVS